MELTLTLETSVIEKFPDRVITGSLSACPTDAGEETRLDTDRPRNAILSCLLSCQPHLSKIPCVIYQWEVRHGNAASHMKTTKDSSGRNTSGTGSKGLMTRWSVKKAPDHEAVRQRENQRRHRERVKDYISELESKVECQQTQLLRANERIEELLREVEALKKQSAYRDPSPCSLPQSTRPTTFPPTDQGPAGGTTQTRRTRDTTLHPADDIVPQCYRPGSCDPGATDVSDGEDLPAPGAGESTTGCRAAFRILEQQSMDPLDIGAVEQFLRPGYRRALRRGDGCRVDSHLFFGLLDKITP